MDFGNETPQPAIVETVRLNAKLMPKFSVTLAIAKAIATAACNEAKANQWPVSIAIIDVGGNLVYFERDDNCQYGSIIVSQEKAKSALYFKRPTKDLSDRVLIGGINMLSLPGFVAVDCNGD